MEEENIILVFIMFVIGIVWFLLQYNKSKMKKPRNPYEETIYQEEIARQQARKDFNRERINQIKNQKWKKNIARNIERSWRF